MTMRYADKLLSTYIDSNLKAMTFRPQSTPEAHIRPMVCHAQQSALSLAPIPFHLESPIQS